MENLLGKLAFLVGVLLALFGGIWAGVSVPENDTVILILLIAGILIGLLNITPKEAPAVLSATVALIIVCIWSNTFSFINPIDHLSTALAENFVGVVTCFAILMAPAAIIIAIKVVLATADRD